MGRKRGRLTPVHEKKKILALIDDACLAGARLEKACSVVDLSIRTVQRWRNPENIEDKRKKSDRIPGNKLTEIERHKILQIANNKEYRDMSPQQIVVNLADKGVYLASESTVYRILREEGQNTHRLSSKPRKNTKPEELVASKRNQVWTWDITYLQTPTKGIFLYLYMIMDLYSRKIIAWQIHNREDASLAAELIIEGCYLEKIDKDQLVLHSDNGSPMKGATMLATFSNWELCPPFPGQA